MTRLQKTILLTMAVFALEALPFGAWLALIPVVKEQLALNKAQLAFALLGLPFGVIPSLQVSGRLIMQIGPRRILAAALPAQAAVVCLPLLAPSAVTLFLTLLVLGAVIGLLQVGLNVYAGRLEKQCGLSVMNRCHGFWALGVMAGSLLVTLMPLVPPLGAIVLIGAPSAALGIWVAFSLQKLDGHEGGPPAARRRLRQLSPRLALIALCTLAASMTEGAMSDWSAVYLAERLPPGATYAGIAVSIFAGCLATGRFLGDWAKMRFGVVTLARAALGCAAAGLLLLIVPLPLWTSYLGFACVGLGVSVGFPLGVSAAAQLDDTHEGPNIAILSTVTVIGFLVGPPLIGGLAELFSLRVGLAVLLPGLVMGVFLARALKSA